MSKKFPSDEERLLTVTQVARWLGVAESTIYRWVKDGRFPVPICLGDPGNPHAAMRYRKGEIDEWLNARPKAKSDKDIFVSGPRDR